MSADVDVVASALEVVEIAEVGPLLARDETAFTEAERAYARAQVDPERRLAARLAAKKAACRLLGEGFGPSDVEVLPARGGPPRLRFTKRAEERLRALGAERALVSLTHGETQAAASVLFVGGAS